MTTHRLFRAFCALTLLLAPRAMAQTVPLQVHSTDENFVLREVVGQASTSVWTRYGYVGGYSQATTPLCASPCRLEASTGYHLVDIVVNGRRHGNWHFSLDRPSTLVAQRHSRLGRRIFRAILGVALTTAGGLAMARGLLLPRDAGWMTKEGCFWTILGGAGAATGLSVALTAHLARDRWSVTVTPD